AGAANLAQHTAFAPFRLDGTSNQVHSFLPNLNNDRLKQILSIVQGISTTSSHSTSGSTLAVNIATIPSTIS
ncbi:hypothetical protein Dimus_022377, partial [Dionaea muscipula]